jgi:hypothetical protein
LYNDCIISTHFDWSLMEPMHAAGHAISTNDDGTSLTPLNLVAQPALTLPDQGKFLSAAQNPDGF